MNYSKERWWLFNWLTTRRNSHLVLNWVPSPHVTLQPLRGDQADQPPCTTSQEKHLWVELFGLACTTSQLLIFEFGLARKTPCLAVVEVVWQWCFAQQAAPQRAVGLVAKAESQIPSFGKVVARNGNFGKKWRCVAIFATIVTHRLFFWATDIWQTTWESTYRASQVPDHLGRVFLFKSSVVRLLWLAQ